ncbi:glutathione S-transferase family protein [Ramlibacter rhizophilus]|uniref:Glutathione S-transferase family protein n=1 Tax=Ramlibacter rhizophilus TaxID=1781167 RepID=A0A4Z0BJU1_9BURK|nr:glutathione S-transferase family protein [Ramlibacter rhizophilus]TFY99556.1 glutathione S-transferase family protein [Ramlibacter rhizophilus]
MLRLYIGNKNYSSWSMRAGVLLRQAGIEFEEVMLRFDSFGEGSRFKTALAQVSPAQTVPVLVDEDFAVWDSLAIAEYVAERFPARQLWPQDGRARARARSVCAEMHSGFSALRHHCPMNIEALLPEAGAQVWREQAQVRADIARIVAIWTELLAQHPHAEGMLFGRFSIADAFFAPVCMRITTYALPVSEVAEAYMARVRALPAVRAWIDEALGEQDFVAFDEPYRTGRG